jgi:SAM-dependent methyltransferase
MILDFNMVYALISRFERSGQVETPSTPTHLVSEMLDKLPPEIWSDSSKTFYDPACSTGTFLLEVVRRLNVGLASQMPGQTKRLRHILTKQVWGSEMSHVPFLVAQSAFEKLFINTTGIVGAVNIYHANALDGVEEIKDMKFDVVVMNPPYNKPVHKDGRKGGYGGRSLWDKFLKKAIDELIKEDGYLVSVNPSAWRKPESDRSKTLFRKLCHENHMEYLEIHSKADGNKTFGASTRFDFFCIHKGIHDGSTVVCDEEGFHHNINLMEKSWLPNFEFELFDKLMQGEDEKASDVIFSSSAYETRKKHIKTECTEEFTHPVIHSMGTKGVGYIYSNDNTKGHFGQSKVILSFNEKQQCPVNDYKGEFGMSQITFGIPVESKEDGDKLIEFIKSETGRDLILASKWSTFQTDWRMFQYFKEGFWR